MKKYAFILMGPNYTPDKDRVDFETGGLRSSIYTVRNFEEAKKQVQLCQQEGYGCVELCGAFGEAKTRELIQLTDGKMAIGFVTHLSEQDFLFDKFFSKE